MGEFRSGFVGILGRPNVGKSTLLNRLCGEKLAIISSTPQTTRNRILGVHHRPGSQIVFLDTPGMHDAGKALNRYMQGVITGVANDVDTIVYMVDAARRHGREDEMTISMLPNRKTVPVVLAVNKVDIADASKIRKRVDLLDEMYPFAAVFTISALEGIGTDELAARLSSIMPEGPPYFPDDMVTDQPLGFRLSEMIREKLIELTRDEVPHSTAVVVEEITTEDDGSMEVAAKIFVERDSQKSIIIGKGGKMIRQVGSGARLEMERSLGKKVHLKLWVKVRKGWTDRASVLRDMGYGS